MIHEMRKREYLFTEIKTMKLYVGTWNLNGEKLTEELDISNWLLPFEKETFQPDIVVIGF